MCPTSIYRLKGPTSWPDPPVRFSFSSLTAIDVCPLQWQLKHARYDEMERFPARPHPAAVEGDIVHRALDSLFKALSLAGLPEIGTATFREEVARVDVKRVVERLLTEHEARLSGHPRGVGFRVRVSPQELVNRVIRLFRAEYSRAVVEPDRERADRPVSAPAELSGKEMLELLQFRGALSELGIEHPMLPFVGIIDLVRAEDGAVVILDFKTGQSKPAHETQVLVYGVLWWRKAGRPPDRVQVRYPGDARVLAVDARTLADEERKLKQRIEEVASTLANPPAAGCIGEHCRYCDVRQFCDAHWGAQPEELSAPKGRAGKTIDVELIVDGTPSSNGFSARTRKGSSTCTVVHSSDGAKVHGPFVDGEALRILNGRLAESGETLELMPWTEVFHR